MKIVNKISSWAVLFLLLSLAGLSCRENEYRLQTKTPAVQKILNQRKTRSPELQALKAKGLIGENNKGFITILKPPLRPQEENLIDAENHDRKFIYSTVVAQNHLGSESLAKVEAEFSKTRHSRARKGDFIQTSSGKWARK